MWLIITAVFVVLVLYLLYDFLSTRRTIAGFVRRSPTQTGEYYSGNKDKKKLSVLLIGDSIAAGTGIKNFNESVGGRLANALGKKYYVNFVNHAWPGARLSELAKNNYAKNWDLVVIIAGSNDLIGRTPETRLKQLINDLLDKLAVHGKTILLVGPGDVASTKVFPFWIMLGMARKQKRLAKIMAAAAYKHNVLYANPLEYKNSPDYFAKDGLHPNALGHKLWFKIIWDKIKDRY